MKVLRSAFRFVLGLVAATIAAELVLRIISATPLWQVLPVPTIMFYGPNADTGFSHRPNVSGIWTAENRTQVRTSSLGLRDRERPLKRGDAPRAIVIGDSLIEAVQVEQEDTSTAVAERILSAKHPGAEVVNLGLAGRDAGRAGGASAIHRPRLAARCRGAAGHARLAIVRHHPRRQPQPGLQEKCAGTLRIVVRIPRRSRIQIPNVARRAALVYWLLDHSMVARVINARRNAGWFAEWPKPVQQPELTSGPQDECHAERMARQRALWVDGQPAEAAGILDAVIRDLSTISRDNKLPVVLVDAQYRARLRTDRGRAQGAHRCDRKAA